MADIVLGVDVGGTSIKVGAFSLDGELLASGSFPTPSIVTEAAYAVVCEGLDELISNLPNVKVVAIGLDVPGPVDSNGTLCLTSNSEIDLEGLKAAISGHFEGVKLVVLNDANAAALGEMWQGGAKAYSNFVMIALGTGVGGAVVIDEKVIAGAHGCAGELGHVTIEPDEGTACGCGRFGCLEQYASATGIVRLYKEFCEKAGVETVRLAGKSDSKSVFDAAEKGDICAIKAIDMMCEYLGRAMAITSAIVNPEAYVFGGGVAAGFDNFKDRLEPYFVDNAVAGSGNTALVVAKLGNSAAIYGSALEAIRSL